MLARITSSDLTAVDFYCGIGGSTSGLNAAGIRVRLAANHSKVAIATHSANHPHIDHYLGDIQALDLRRLPKARILWASPICTEVSPAGGKAKRTAQMELWERDGHVSTESFERTRVTFWEVIRAAELWRYDLVLIENVVEAAAWELFDVWLNGMETLGYEVQFCSVSAAHVGSEEEDNDPAPQWRDRLYMALRLRGIPPLDLDPRPLAHCFVCNQDVASRQWWKKPGRRIGKYGPQYLYVCPTPHRKDEPSIVEPYVAPVSRAINWSDPGTRIGDRPRPLGAATMKRIQYGLDTFGHEPVMVAGGGNTWDAASGSGNNYWRAWPANESPAGTQTGAAQNGVATIEPFVSILRANDKNHSVSRPVPTISTGRNHGLVIPYRKGSKAHRPDQPVSTMATKSQHGLLQTAVDINDCHFRMFTPRESANTQRFAPDYILTGSKGEQQLGAGNAVAVNVAQWIGTKAIEALS